MILCAMLQWCNGDDVWDCVWQCIKCWIGVVITCLDLDPTSGRVSNAIIKLFCYCSFYFWHPSCLLVILPFIIAHAPLFFWAQLWHKEGEWGVGFRDNTMYTIHWCVLMIDDPLCYGAMVQWWWCLGFCLAMHQMLNRCSHHLSNLRSRIWTSEQCDN